MLNTKNAKHRECQKNSKGMPEKCQWSSLSFLQANLIKRLPPWRYLADTIVSFAKEPNFISHKRFGFVSLLLAVVEVLKKFFFVEVCWTNNLLGHASANLGEQSEQSGKWSFSSVQTNKSLATCYARPSRSEARTATGAWRWSTKWSTERSTEWSTEWSSIRAFSYTGSACNGKIH